MAWAAVAAAAVSAVGAGVSAYSANKRAKQAGAGFDELIKYAGQNPGVFGEKLDFESLDYSPLFRQDPGYANLAGDTIAGNQRNLPAAQNLARDTNDFITQDSRRRVESWMPSFQTSLNQQSQNTMSMLRGEIPAEDRNAITGRSAERSALGGGAFNQQQTLADLGISRLDAMERGAANLTNNANLLNIVDPINRRITPQSMFVDTSQAIQQAVSENQFDAQFAQAERNAELQYALTPDPQQAGMLNLMSAKAGMQASMPTQSVFGSALAAGASSFGSAYAGSMGGGGGQAAAASQAAPQYVQTTNFSGPRYASAADQAAGYQSLSGTGAYGGAYNPATGGEYGQQGGLWSYTNTAAPRTDTSPWKQSY